MSDVSEGGAISPEERNVETKGTTFEVGQAVVYGDRIYEIKSINGDEAEIYAKESTHEITSVDMKGGNTHESVAEEYGGTLRGEVTDRISPDGEKYKSDTVIFPEVTQVVKLSELERWGEATS
jgi:hypothetical protein